MKKLSVLALAIAATFSGVAQASVIQVEAANATSGFLGSAEEYRDAVDAALQGPSYASQMLSSYDNVTHQSLFGGNSNFAMKSTISFGIATAGSFAFRAGVDFGFGGAMFLDGVALDFKSNDMWWAGSYGNESQFFLGESALAVGNHVLQIYGFEGCCDGGQQVQFLAPGETGVWTSFSNVDGLDLVNKVPEPGSIALLLTGAALIGTTRRRRQAARQA
jgi:hypothetical protein